MGFGHWFQDKIDSAKLDQYHIARVVAVNKDNYLLRNESNEVLAEITGKFMFRADSPLDYPAVGDWVYVKYFDNGSFAVIDELFPRKTVLKRKTSGKKIEFQLIAANIDTAFIMQSLDTNFNLRRLERYLAMINESNIRPIVLLSKSDLISLLDLEEKKCEIRTVMPEITFIAFSNLNHSGVEEIKAKLVAGETYCLLGSSGVGKTTLVNTLVGETLFDTQAVREKDGKGRHTTGRRQLHSIKNGALLVDTPGMRELGNIGIDSGLNATFDEIAEYSSQCRYTDCSHTQEDGCALLAAVHEGKISRDRYESYLRLRKESKHYEMSYLEKRRQDKKFGKMCKSVMKHNVKK